MCGPSEPGAGVKLAPQLAVVTFSDCSVQAVKPEDDPSRSRLTPPTGVIAVPADVSFTYTMQGSLAFTATEDELHVRKVAELLGLTVMLAAFLLDVWPLSPV